MAEKNLDIRTMIRSMLEDMPEDRIFHVSGHGKLTVLRLREELKWGTPIGRQFVVDTGEKAILHIRSAPLI